MSLRAQLDATLAIAEATGKIAKVYKHLVYVNNNKDMLTFFKDVVNGRIDCAFITREATSSEDNGPDNNYDMHQISLSWYRTVSRAADDSINSEDGFQDDVEAVRAAFNTNRKLTVNATHNAPSFASPMEARVVGYVMFQESLCHYAELVFAPKDGPNATRSA